MNRPVKDDPIDPTSDALISAAAAVHSTLTLDFRRTGPALTGLVPYNGLPYNVVYSSQPDTTLTFFENQSESDGTTAKLPSLPKVETWFGFNQDGRSGQPTLPPTLAWVHGPPSKDCHGLMVVVDPATNRIVQYQEVYKLCQANDLSGWQCGGLAIFDALTGAPRTGTGWTSPDLAGLPVFHLLARVEELRYTGRFNHPLRCTRPAPGVHQEQRLAGPPRVAHEGDRLFRRGVRAGVPDRRQDQT